MIKKLILIGAMAFTFVLTYIFMYILVRIANAYGVLVASLTMWGVSMVMHAIAMRVSPDEPDQLKPFKDEDI